MICLVSAHHFFFLLYRRIFLFPVSFCLFPLPLLMPFNFFLFILVFSMFCNFLGLFFLFDFFSCLCLFRLFLSFFFTLMSSYLFFRLFSCFPLFPPHFPHFLLISPPFSSFLFSRLLMHFHPFPSSHFFLPQTCALWILPRLSPLISHLTYRVLPCLGLDDYRVWKSTSSFRIRPFKATGTPTSSSTCKQALTQWLSSREKRGAKTQIINYFSGVSLRVSPA